MIRPHFCCVVVPLHVAVDARRVACGGSQTRQPRSPSATPAAPRRRPRRNLPPRRPSQLLEPIEGAMGGHIDTFRWSPVAGADGYVIKIVAVTGDRVVWESAPMTATETKLPATVALEPEVHTWTRLGAQGRRGAGDVADAEVHDHPVSHRFTD